MEHHPVFAEFRPYEGPRDEDVHVDFIGAQCRLGWYCKEHWPATVMSRIPPPPLDEEYFEWVDLLESVNASSGSFTMMELGAGWGRWGIRGGLAAKQRGLQPRLIFVEAEPQ